MQASFDKLLKNYLNLTIGSSGKLMGLTLIHSFGVPEPWRWLNNLSPTKTHGRHLLLIITYFLVAPYNPRTNVLLATHFCKWTKLIIGYLTSGAPYTLREGPPRAAAGGGFRVRSSSESKKNDVTDVRKQDHQWRRLVVRRLSTILASKSRHIYVVVKVPLYWCHTGSASVF